MENNNLNELELKFLKPEEMLKRVEIIQDAVQFEMDLQTKRRECVEEKKEKVKKEFDEIEEELAEIEQIEDAFGSAYDEIQAVICELKVAIHLNSKS